MSNFDALPVHVSFRFSCNPLMSAAHGFLAIEYFLLTVNLSFIVFAFPGGLHVLKFSGSVSARTPLFFVPFEEIASDPDLVSGSEDSKR
jgi:hypothetical protein